MAQPIKIEFRELSEEREEEIEDQYAHVIATRKMVEDMTFATYNVTREQAAALVEKYGEDVDRGTEVGSYTYYIVDKIVDKELLAYAKWHDEYVQDQQADRNAEARFAQQEEDELNQPPPEDAGEG